MGQLDGTRALVTSVMSGLGRAMAAALGYTGAFVVVTSRQLERARRRRDGDQGDWVFRP